MKACMAFLMVLGSLVGAAVPAAMAQPVGPVTLTGTSWALESYGTPGAETPILPGSSVTLTFASDNTVTGHGGCNGYSGDYAVDGNRITIGQVISTMMACADNEVTRQEQTYFAALGSAGQFELRGSRLIVRYAGGQQLTFVSLDAPVSPVPPHFENLDSPVDLLGSYYNAIVRQDYQRAYGYWEIPPHAYDDFVNGFAATTGVQVIVEPPIRYEGAAGSTYVSIPTVLIAQHTDGTVETYAGCFVTRKSNLMPPDIPQEDVWHLYSADLTQVPNDAVIPVLLVQACLDDQGIEGTADG